MKTDTEQRIYELLATNTSFSPTHKILGKDGEFLGYVDISKKKQDDIFLCWFCKHDLYFVERSLSLLAMNTIQVCQSNEWIESRPINRQAFNDSLIDRLTRLTYKKLSHFTLVSLHCV